MTDLRRPIVFRALVVAALLAAGNSMPALAGVPGTDSAKAVPKTRLQDSGDHIQILSIQRIDAEDKVVVLLRVDNGYHINANPASEPYLIPTTLAFNGITPLRILYPAATRFRPRFVTSLSTSTRALSPSPPSCQRGHSPKCRLSRRL